MSATKSEDQRPDRGDPTEHDPASLVSGPGSDAAPDVRDVRSEAAVAVGVVIFGALFIILGSRLRQGAIPDPVTTGGMPIGIGVMLVVLGSVVASRAINAWRRHEIQILSEGGNDEPGYPASWMRTFAFAAGCLVWAYLIPRLSYVLMTPIFLGLALWGFGVRSWRKLIIVPIAFTTISWYLFGRILTVRLPWGVFESWAREMGLIL